MSTRVSLPALAHRVPLAARLTHTVRAAAFWTAVVSPIGYPVLLSVGLEGTTGLAFLGLLCLNALALAVGHDYDPSEDGETASHGATDPPGTRDGTADTR
jgi:hypothetical protein